MSKEEEIAKAIKKGGNKTANHAAKILTEVYQLKTVDKNFDAKFEQIKAEIDVLINQNT